MRRLIIWAAVAAALGLVDFGVAAQRAATTTAAPLIDYTTDGADPQQIGRAHV